LIVRQSSYRVLIPTSVLFVAFQRFNADCLADTLTWSF